MMWEKETEKYVVVLRKNGPAEAKKENFKVGKAKSVALMLWFESSLSLLGIVDHTVLPK